MTLQQALAIAARHAKPHRQPMDKLQRGTTPDKITAGADAPASRLSVRRCLSSSSQMAG
jgi:hypothetical protein